MSSFPSGGMCAYRYRTFLRPSAALYLAPKLEAKSSFNYTCLSFSFVLKNLGQPYIVDFVLAMFQTPPMPAKTTVKC